MARKLMIGTCLAIGMAWLFAVSMLAHRFNIPSADGILYSLPFATARHPLDLGVPYLGNFDGYGTSWGHQWPGTMWLRGAVFEIIPFSRLADVAVLSIFHLLVAVAAAAAVWKAGGGPIPSFATLVTLLSDRLLLLACAGNRIEAPAVAAVVVLLTAVLKGQTSHGNHWRWIGAVGAFFCASSHPYSMVLGGAILCVNLQTAWRSSSLLFRQWPYPAVGFFLGIIATGSWFLADPAAMNQFQVNMALQKTFYHNWTSVWAGLSNYRLHAGVLLWSAGLIAGFVHLARPNQSVSEPPTRHARSLQTYSLLLLSLVIVIHTMTRCENFHYLAFGAPFAAILVFSSLGACMTSMSGRFKWLAYGAMAALLLPHTLVLPHRLSQFIKAGRPNLHSSYGSILDSIPEGRAIYISHTLWPAAAENKSHPLRWFTFPIASDTRSRKRYEEIAYADAKKGDVLILDPGSAGQPDRFGLFPTFPTNPPDPRKWRHIRDHQQIFPGSIPWGINLSIFEYQN